MIQAVSNSKMNNFNKANQIAFSANPAKGKNLASEVVKAATDMPGIYPGDKLPIGGFGLIRKLPIKDAFFNLFKKSEKEAI